MDSGPDAGGGGGAVGGAVGPGRGGAPGPGSGGIAGSAPGGLSGQGGVGGSPIGTGGRGGIGGTFSTGGTSGPGGGAGTQGGRGGIGGTFSTGGTSGTQGGRGGIGGTFSTGGTSGTQGGRGGIAGTFSTGGSAGTAGRGGIGGTAGSGGTGGARLSHLPGDAAADPAARLVYNAARNQIYASVAGDADAYPNTIVVVDPSTSSVVSSIPVGSNPGALALSDDGSTLWVGIDGARAFRKVTLTSTPPAVGPLHHLPKASPDAFFTASSMAALPGAPLSVAIAMEVATLYDYSYTTSEVRVFDDGVPRATGVKNVPTPSFIVAGPPGYVFGANTLPRRLLRAAGLGVGDHADAVLQPAFRSPERHRLRPAAG